MFWLLAVGFIIGLAVLFGVPLIRNGFKTSYEQRSWEQARFQVSTGSSTLTPDLAAARSGMTYRERQNLQQQEQADSYF